MKEALLGKTPAELRECALAAGLPAFAGGQIARWLYVRRVGSFDEMTDLSKAGRERLKELYETGVTPPAGFAESVDGTRKYLFPVSCPVGGRMEESAVEAVVIPDAERRTLCVSSQAGCKMGCRFCMTGRQGFHGNLSAAQILNQFVAIPETQALTNAVFMGMYYGIAKRYAVGMYGGKFFPYHKGHFFCLETASAETTAPVSAVTFSFITMSRLPSSHIFRVRCRSSSE